MLINNLLMLDFEPVFRHPAMGLFQASRAPAPHDGAHHSEEKQPFVNEDEPPMNTNRHED